MRPLLLLVAALALTGCTGRADSRPTPSRPASTSTPSTTPTTDPFKVDPVQIAAMFVEAARDHRPKVHVPIDTPVELYLGNELVTTISATAAYEDRGAWGICGAGAGDRTCPLSALAAVRQAAGVRIDEQPGDLPCTRLPKAPGGVRQYLSITIAGGSSCFDSFAVTLYVNDVGQIVAVRLVWDGP